MHLTENLVVAFPFFAENAMLTLMIYSVPVYSSDIFQNIQCLDTYFYGTVKDLRVAVTKLLMD